MVVTLAMVAFGADPLVAVELTGPSGAVALSDELPLPSTRTLPSPDGKYAVGVYVTAFDTTRAVVEVAIGKAEGDGVKAKVRQSFELDRWAPQSHAIVYKKDTWKLDATLGLVWSAPEPNPIDDPQRYVLVWDDAEMWTTAPPKPGEKKKGKVATVRERELPGGRTDPLTQASPMRIVDTGDDTVFHLESVVEAGRSHCQLGGAPSETAPAERWVNRADFVARVTSREVVGKFPDGTGYRVAAGVPVTEEGEGRYRVSTGGLSFVIETADKDDIAFYYRGSGHFDAMAEHPVSFPAGTLGQTALGPVTWAGPEPIPVAGLRGVAHPRATVRVPCAEARVAPADGALGAR